MNHLILFMTEHMSLRKWIDKGLFPREIALYKELSKYVKVSIVSYAASDESELISDTPNIEVICNVQKLADTDYVLTLPQRIEFDPLHTVVKTNQIKGAHLAALFAHATQLPLIARAGYLQSDFARNKFTLNFIRKRLHLAETIRYEKEIFSLASLIVVSTDLIKSQIIEQHGISGERIRVVPNYVDTSVFKYVENGRIPNRVIYTGRLEAQKNLFSLIEACSALPGVELFLVGEGSFKPKLEKLTRKLNVNAHFLGRVPNHDLPALLAVSSVFVLPSNYEGHPKSLIEAMATGIAVLGTDVAGIREVIQSGVTGLLCGTKPQEIATKLAILLRDKALCHALGKDGHRYATEHFSLRSIVELELENITLAMTSLTTSSSTTAPKI